MRLVEAQRALAEWVSGLMALATDLQDATRPRCCPLHNQKHGTWKDEILRGHLCEHDLLPGASTMMVPSQSPD